MSVHLLDNRSLPVTLPDELEAFLHVLLYNAVRFLHHNYNSTIPFVKKYFDGRDEVGGTLFSSEHKSDCVRVHGNVKFRGSELSFGLSNGGDHALNAILRELFHLFRGRYAVLDYDTAKQALMARLEEEKKQEKLLEEDLGDNVLSTPSHCSNASDILLFEVDRYINEELDSGEQDAAMVDEKASARAEKELASLKEPTEYDKICQANCQQHDTFLRILTKRRKLGLSVWDEADRIKGDSFQHHVQDSDMLYSAYKIERLAKIMEMEYRLSRSTKVRTT